jgi:hypothetical protein
MHVYLVYDRNTGRILHTVSKYMMGQAEAVPMEPEEVLAELGEDLRGPHVGVATLPVGFTPGDRSQRISIEARTGVARMMPAPSRPPAGAAPQARSASRKTPAGKARSSRKGARK